MAAQKRARRKRASKKRLAKRNGGGGPTRGQKRSVKESLGLIKNDAKDIGLRIDRVLNTLNEVDFIDD
jgi:hypothetical protein